MSNEPICICGKQMKIIRGSFGQFYGCHDWPECQHVEKMDEQDMDDDDD